MPMDGLTIGAVTHEINSLLENARVDRINQPEADEVVLFMRTRGENRKLLLSSNASLARITLTNSNKPNPLTPPAFCMLLRKHLTGARLVSLTQEHNERIVSINFETINDFNELEAKSLIIEIMGKYSNIILTDGNGKILDSIKRVSSIMSRVRTVLPGNIYELPPTQGKLDPFNCALPDIPKNARMISDTFTGVSRQAAEEIVYLCGDAPFAVGFNRLIEKYKSGKLSPVLQKDENGNPVDYYAFRQERFLDEFQEQKGSVSEAIEEYFFLKDRAQRIQERSHVLRLRLNTLLEKNQKKSQQQHEKLLECADMEKYRIYGELLTANIYKVQKGAKSVTVENYYDNMTPLEIPLDNTVSANANAQKYFKTYNKLKTASRLLISQMKETDDDIDFLLELTENLSKCEYESDIHEIHKELCDRGFIKAAKTKQRNEPSKPMHFVSDSGIDIFVGKNNTQNDELTMHLAKSDELWLHTKDVHGSHVIIRSNEPDNKTIEQGAMLAVYYSKGRLSSLVPVDATKRRYIKKPAGSAAGKVIYTNQTTYYITVDENEIRKIKRV